MGAVLKNIRVRNFLGYSEQQDIEVAIPNEKNGSGMTFIVGEINTGKSAIFEAAKKLNANAKFLPKERNKGNAPIIQFTDVNGKMTSVTKGKKATVDIQINGLIDGKSFELIPSRRHWQHTFSANNIRNFDQYLERTYTYGKTTEDSHLGGLLEKISDNSQYKEKFNKLMAFLVPGFSDWEIDTNDHGQDYVKYKVNDDVIHDTSLLGDGIISLFRIAAHLTFTSSDSALYIDEPELSLSPSIQKRLAQIFAQESANRQIIVNTHCTNMIRWEDLLNGGKIYRTSKNIKSGACQIKRLNTDSESFKKILSGLENWQKPHMLDAVAKEIFFSDTVLFLEGQEDVGLIKKFIVDNNILINFDIFGYGAGGADKISAFFQMAEELGIKAAAIFDLGAHGIEDAKKFKSFMVTVLKYNDIRHKPGKPNNTGLFDEHGDIAEEKAQELKGIIHKINEFFADIGGKIKGNDTL